MADLYKGQVAHARYVPTSHAFAYDVCMVLVDITDLSSALAGMWPLAGVNTWGCVATFNERDHMKGELQPGQSLSYCVRRVVQRETGTPVPRTARIKLLTHLQYFGYCFNPISVYYVYNGDNTRVDTVIAEVSNTPWMEMHLYVLARGAAGVQHEWTSVTGQGGSGTEEELMAGPPVAPAVPGRGSAVRGASPRPSVGRAGGRAGSASRASLGKRAQELAQPAAVGESVAPRVPSAAVPTFLPPSTRLLHYEWAKAFHVSPFMGMDQSYHWSFSEPAGVLMTRSVNTRVGDGARMLTTQLRLTRQGSGGGVSVVDMAWTVLVAFPLLTWRLQWWIHYEAVRLFRKGVALYPHPTGASNSFTRTVEGLVDVGLWVVGVLTGALQWVGCRRARAPQAVHGLPAAR